LEVSFADDFEILQLSHPIYYSTDSIISIILFTALGNTNGLDIDGSQRISLIYEELNSTKSPSPFISLQK
jgi:hypothetical protein